MKNNLEWKWLKSSNKLGIGIFFLAFFMSMSWAGVCIGQKTDCPDLPACDTYDIVITCTLEFPPGGRCVTIDKEDEIVCQTFDADNQWIKTTKTGCTLCGSSGDDSDEPEDQGWGQGPGPWWM